MSIFDAIPADWKTHNWAEEICSLVPGSLLFIRGSIESPLPAGYMFAAARHSLGFSAGTHLGEETQRGENCHAWRKNTMAGVIDPQVENPRPPHLHKCHSTSSLSPINYSGLRSLKLRDMTAE